MIVKVNFIFLLLLSIAVYSLSSLFLYPLAATPISVNTYGSLVPQNELFILNVKEYNSANNTNFMSNNTNSDEVPNEGSFKSKKPIESHPVNESIEVVNDPNNVTSIHSPGVPDEQRFRELKAKANEPETTQQEDDNTTQEDK
jgi:hypothetical protein